MKLSGKTVLLTGAGSGMGREMTLELARRGAKVVAVDFREDTLLETVELSKNLGGTVTAFTLDVSDAALVAALPKRVSESVGPIDCLINNAGIIQPFVPINELSLKDARHVMSVNFDGPLSLIKAFLPELLSRPEGHILNVSSMGAYAPVPGQSVYGASKAALKLLTEGLRSELMSTKVGVTIAFPGAIATNITVNSGLIMPAGAAESSTMKTTAAPVAARIMLDAIETNNPRVCVGSDAKIMDRLSRLNPIFAANLIYKQMKSLLKTMAP